MFQRSGYIRLIELENKRVLSAFFFHNADNFVGYNRVMTAAEAYNLGQFQGGVFRGYKGCLEHAYMKVITVSPRTREISTSLNPGRLSSVSTGIPWRVKNRERS